MKDERLLYIMIDADLKRRLKMKAAQKNMTLKELIIPILEDLVKPVEKGDD